MGPLKLNSLRGKRVHGGFHVVNRLGDARIFEQGSKFRCDGERETDAGLRGDAEHGAILLLGRFGYIEKAKR